MLCIYKFNSSMHAVCYRLFFCIFIVYIYRMLSSVFCIFIVYIYRMLSSVFCIFIVYIYRMFIVYFLLKYYRMLVVFLLYVYRMFILHKFLAYLFYLTILNPLTAYQRTWVCIFANRPIILTNTGD